MKKGNFILGVVVGILIMAILAAGFYLGTKYVGKNDDKKDEETKEVEKEKDSSVFKDVKLTDDLVEEASAVNVYGFCGGLIYNFPEKSVTVDELSDSLKTEMAFVRFAQKIYNKIDEATDYEHIDPYKIEENDLKRYFADLSFLSKYKNGKEFYLSSVAAGGVYKNGAFYFTPEITGCIGPGDDGYASELIEAKKNDKELVLTYVVYYREFKINDDDEVFINAFITEKDKKATETKIKYDEEKDRYDVNLDLYHKYEYVFDISEGNLQLKAINYVK